MPSPLDRLDDVDWSRLRHAYGEASDLPGFIRDLVSPDAAARERALWELFGNIWHQGTVYPATEPAIPILNDLLADPSTPDRDSIAMLLACIASGGPYFDGKRVHWNVLAPNATLSDEEVEIEGRRVLAAIHSAVSERLLMLLPYLAAADSAVREEVGKAFGYYPEHARITLPALERALAIEDEGVDAEWTRAIIEESIERLRGSGRTED